MPKVHEATLKKEVERLVKISVLKRINQSELAALKNNLEVSLVLFVTTAICGGEDQGYQPPYPV